MLLLRNLMCGARTRLKAPWCGRRSFTTCCKTPWVSESPSWYTHGAVSYVHQSCHSGRILSGVELPLGLASDEVSVLNVLKSSWRKRKIGVTYACQFGCWSWSAIMQTLPTLVYVDVPSFSHVSSSSSVPTFQESLIPRNLRILKMH